MCCPEASAHPHLSLCIACVAPSLHLLHHSCISAPEPSVGAGSGHNGNWRGIHGRRVTDAFVDNFMGQRGGTEMAAMSVSTDRAEAEKFAKWDADCCVPNDRFCCCAPAVLLKLVVDKPENYGAGGAWLSMYAGEREVLFPPLTYLKCCDIKTVYRRHQRTIITVRPQF